MEAFDIEKADKGGPTNFYNLAQKVKDKKSFFEIVVEYLLPNNIPGELKPSL